MCQYEPLRINDLGSSSGRNQNSALSEKLQMDGNLTLEKVVAQDRQSEAVKEQQAVVRGQGLEKRDISPYTESWYV